MNTEETTRVYSTMDIARICHEANRALQMVQDDPAVPVSPTWDDISENEQNGVIAGVDYALGRATPEQLHQNWCDAKFAAGWTYGIVKDAGKREHPNLVAYPDLADDQKLKDDLFAAIVTVLS